MIAALRRTKWRPREQRQAQVDGRGIERVDRVLAIDTERLVHIAPARDANQVLCKLRVDAPIARFVRIGQRAARDRTTNAEVIELGRLRSQAGLDIAQTLAVAQLREGHVAELIGAAEFA